MPAPMAPNGAFMTRTRRYAEVEALLGERPCARCQGVGIAPLPEDGGPRRYARCRCQRPLDQARAFNAALIPRTYSSFTLENWLVSDAGQAHVRQVAERWVTEVEQATELHRVPFLVLTGGPGVGKTHLAVALLRRLILDGKRPGLPMSARFLEPSVLAQGFKNGEALHLQDRLAADLVVLDDVVAPRTDFERAVIDELISRRYRTGGPCIVTTTLSAQEFGETLGARIASRLFEGRLTWVAGRDRRMGMTA